MTVNKEGLEAAHARLEELSGMRNIPSILTRSGREFIAEKAIAAYLAALPAPDGLVERLRADAAQLIRMSKATEFGKDLSVRVKAPDLLIASLTEAATVIQTLQRERGELRAALRPFAERAVGYEHLPAFETDARFQHLRRARLLLKEGGE